MRFLISHDDVLHKRTIVWFQITDLIQKAVEHAFQISSSSKVSQLIEEYALPLFYQGES
jgi:ATP/maltotriose-dependent transcriptional regulator MalT